MNKEDQSFYYNPTKTQLILWTIAWFISSLLVVLAFTDLFRQNSFQFDNLIMGSIISLMVIGSTVSTIKLYRNYYSSENSIGSHE